MRKFKELNSNEKFLIIFAILIIVAMLITRDSFLVRLEKGMKPWKEKWEQIFEQQERIKK